MAADRFRRAIGGLVLGAACALGGCTDYLARREFISLNTGDAPRANAVVHAIDPWPPHAADASIRHRGQRIQGSLERFDKPPADGAGAAPLPLIVQQGAVQTQK